jgi:putative solute:sodium symporter small subunit
MRDTDSHPTPDADGARDATDEQHAGNAGPDHQTADDPVGDDPIADDSHNGRPQAAAARHPRTDGGTVAAGDLAGSTSDDDVDYLEREVNIFSPSTPFMRDHLRVVWTMFAAWALVVFGPVTATALAPETMTSIVVIGFPLHYLATAIGAPAGALVLSLVYARKRDQLDERYGIDHGTDAASADDEDAPGEPTATDGGVDA